MRFTRKVWKKAATSARGRMEVILWQLYGLGDTHFPDYLNKGCQKVVWRQNSFLISQGIEGFWNDMNEPAIFYSSEGMEEAKKLLPESFPRIKKVRSTFGKCRAS